jgi:glycosyltransferase involved in cell wall biosynthesis
MSGLVVKRGEGEVAANISVGLTETAEPIVDVGIPTHGTPRFLKPSLDSVLGQSHTTWRLTVSYNGTPGDDVEAMVAPYLEDPRIRFVPTGTEVSPAENATRALRTGDAPYVGLLHDDDLWDPEFLARRVAFLEEHPTCGYVFSGSKYINDENRVLYTYDVPLREGLQDRQEFLSVLYRQNVIAVPTVLTRRAAYDAVGLRFEEDMLFDDWEMWLRIAVHFDVGFIDVADASYRIHTTQKTRSSVNRLGVHRLEFLDVADRLLPPDFPRVDRRRARSGAHYRAAYDAVTRREIRRAVSHVGQAFRAHPAAFADPKMAGLATAAFRFAVRQRTLWKPAASRKRDT